MYGSTKVPVRGRVVLEGIRFAASVASAPSAVVALWKTATGGKVVGCLPANPVPEVLFASNLLPVALESPEDLSLGSGHIDAWLTGTDLFPFPLQIANAPHFVFPPTNTTSMEDALDRVEALAEWGGAVSGYPVSEGTLWKSIRAYATLRSHLDALDERCSRETAFLAPEERHDIVRAGSFLPPEAHSRLLSSILGVDMEPAVLPAEGERGDPLLALAKRIFAG